LLGGDAGRANTDGDNNTFLGSSAGLKNESGNDNVFIGVAAGNQNVDGLSNIAIGPSAGSQNNSGHRNIAIGEDALGISANSPVSINENIAIGRNAGFDADASSNIIIGNESGMSIAGNHNVLLGNNIISYGANNSFLGTNTSASFIPTPYGATAIGYGTTISQDHSIIIGDVSNDSTKVGIGTTAPTTWLHIDGQGDDVLRLSSNGENAMEVKGNRLVIVNQQLLVNTYTGKPNYEMSVNGQIACEEVLVEASEDWPDYVFAEDYALMDFENLRSYLRVNKRLPGIPSAAEVAEEGVMIGDMQKRLLEKVEEMALYILQLESRITELEKN
jgi:hypothetical protein